MNHDKRRDENAGYGNSSLVGDDRAGLRAALESRDAVRRAREEATDADGASTTSGPGHLVDDASRGPDRAAAPRSDVLGGRASLDTDDGDATPAN